MKDCNEWAQARTPAGYGVSRREGTLRYAHRLAYCEAHGIPLEEIDGQVVRHKCDNPACVNPDHLELGTYADNNKDMRERGRARGNEGRGPRKKLSDAQVISIRREYDPTEGVGCAALAKRYAVSHQHIWRIVNYRSR